mgnify:CR=1 FL=1
MVMQVDGEVVRDVIPYIGYLHRGGEKLCETMDYRQGIGFMDRTEYLAAFNAELSYVMAVEALAELEVPERAQWLRMILCELNRLSSHFMFMGAFGVDTGVMGTPFIYAFLGREAIIDLFEEVSGDRMMYAYFRPGGLAWDVPTNFVERVREVLQVVRRELADIDGLPFVGEGGVACDDEDAAAFRERGRNLLDHAVREILLLAVATQVVKRQDGDGRLVWQRQHFFRPVCLNHCGPARC